MTTKEKLAAGASKEELIQAYIERVNAAEAELIKENTDATTKEEDGKALYTAMMNYLCKYEDFIDIIDSVNEHFSTLLKLKGFFL